MSVFGCREVLPPLPPVPKREELSNTGAVVNLLHRNNNGVAPSREECGCCVVNGQMTNDSMQEKDELTPPHPIRARATSFHFLYIFRD